jgi:hypothetical protein
MRLLLKFGADASTISAEGHTPSAHPLPMGHTLPPHGSHTASPWATHCLPMGHTLPPRGPHTASPWATHCLPVWPLPVGHTLPPHGPHTASPWATHCLPVGHTLPPRGPHLTLHRLPPHAPHRAVRYTCISCGESAACFGVRRPAVVPRRSYRPRLRSGVRRHRRGARRARRARKARYLLRSAPFRCVVSK